MTEGDQDTTNDAGQKPAPAQAARASFDKTLGRLSTWTSVALVIGILVLPFLVTRYGGPAPSPSLGHTPSAPGPVAKPADGGTANPTDKTAGAQAPDTWSEAEQVSALRECLALLSPVEADITLQEPMRQGQCGSAAPVRLHAIGGAAKVVFEPAPEMNCKLAAGLSRWIETVLQPTARDVLGSRIVRIIGASSYSCRNIYHRAVGPLSEHATGNAVDIGGFVTADGRTVMVGKGWGPTERDIAEAKKKAIETAKAHAEKGGAKTETAKKDDAEKPQSAEGDAVKSKTGAETKHSAESKTAEPKSASDKGGAEKRAEVGSSAEAAEKTVGAADPEAADPAVETGSTDKAGGHGPGEAGRTSPATAAADQAKSMRTTVVVPAAATLTIAKTTESTFLKRLHQGACRVFGTVLGPEANEAHRSHFHFDMKDRKGAPVCH